MTIFSDLDFETLLVSEEANVLQIILNRPDFSNAINTKMGEELRDLMLMINKDPHDLRCIVLTGYGDRAFCAGADLKERNGMTDKQWMQQHEIFESVAIAIMECSLPMIGAVNGAAFGGGLELILACDFAWSSTTARFALPETTLGIMPGLGATQYLPRAVGTRRAKEIILSGSVFSAKEAFSWGLVGKMLEPEELLSQVMHLAQRISLNAPIANREVKKALNHALQSDLRDGYRFELKCYHQTVPTVDRLEGIAAYNEKRKPIFRGK